MPDLPRIPPLLLVLLAVLVIFGLDAVLPWSFTLPGNVPLALASGLAGTALIALAIVTFRRAHTTLDPRVPERSTALVTRGVFALSRNPIYLGFAGWLLACALLVQNWSALLVLCAFLAWMNVVQIPAEERALRKVFGDAFEDYARRVRRWI